MTESNYEKTMSLKKLQKTEENLHEYVGKVIRRRQVKIFISLFIEIIIVACFIRYYGFTASINWLGNSRLTPVLTFFLSTPYAYFLWKWRSEDKLTELEISKLDKKKEIFKLEQIRDLEAEKRLDEIRQVLVKPIVNGSQEFYLQTQRLVRFWQGELGREAQLQAVILIIERYQQSVKEEEDNRAAGLIYLKKLYLDILEEGELVKCVPRINIDYLNDIRRDITIINTVGYIKELHGFAPYVQGHSEQVERLRIDTIDSSYFVVFNSIIDFNHLKTVISASDKENCLPITWVFIGSKVHLPFLTKPDLNQLRIISIRSNLIGYKREPYSFKVRHSGSKFYQSDSLTAPKLSTWKEATEDAKEFTETKLLKAFLSIMTSGFDRKKIIENLCKHNPEIHQAYKELVAQLPEGEKDFYSNNYRIDWSSISLEN